MSKYHMAGDFMQLTERDFRLFDTLHLLGFMSSSQIKKMFFPSYNTCMRRLKKLVDAKYLTTDDLLYNHQRVYWLDRKAINLISTLNDKDVKKRSTSNKVLHFLSCVDFYIAIQNKVKIEEYNPEYSISFNYNGKTYEFRPDIKLKANEKHYFVEIDNSNKPCRIKPKIDNYEKYCESNVYKEVFNKYPRVLFISDNALKIKKMIESIRKIPINYYLIEFSHLDNVNGNAWLKVGKKERCNAWV